MRIAITKPHISTRNKILILLILGIIVRLLFWSSKLSFVDNESISHLRYAESIMNLEIPKTQWIGTKDGFYSYESYPPSLYLITASFGIFASNIFSFTLLAKIVSLIFSLLTLAVSAIYSLKMKNHYVIALVALIPLEWFESLPRFNNDIVVAFFASLVFLVALKEINAKNMIILALFTSLALLSKFTAILLLIPMLLYIWFNSKNLKFILIFLAITAFIAGPWYLRNLLLYGDPLFVPYTEAEQAGPKSLAFFMEGYVFGFFPFCTLGYIEDIVILGVSVFLIYTIMRGLEERFRHMASSKIVDPAALFLPLIFVVWIAVKYVFPSGSAKYLLPALLPLAVISSSGTKNKYIVWFVSISFAYLFIKVLLTC